MEKKFNISNYKKLIDYIKEAKLNFKNFKDNLNKGKNIIMRHDIDFCPERALDLAIIEKKNLFQQLTFFLINTESYNLNAFSNQIILRKIISMGHEIGLHFDASFYSAKDDLNHACKKEISILEKIISRKVNIISFHRPSKIMLNMNSKLAGCNHTYMKKFIQDIDYCSDSEGRWRFNTPFEIIEKNKNNPVFTLHLLTHPIWWTTPSNMSPGEKVDFYL